MLFTITRPTTLVALLLIGSAATAAAQSTAFEDQKLTAPDSQYLSNVGRSVAVQGNRALVSAFADADQGAVYAYERIGGSWTQVQKFTSSDITTTDMFGFDIVMDGDWAFVGTPGADPAGYSSGAVYAFRHNGTQWVERQKLTPAGGSTLDYFGQAVAASGGELVVGAYGDDDQGDKAGAAYVFRLSGGSWIEQQKLTASTPGAGDSFGWDVAMDGAVMAITAINDDEQGQDSGSVYVFRKTGSTWIEEQRVIGSGITGSDQFGWSVGVDANLLVAGATNHDLPVNQGGAVYTFRWDGATWGEEQKLVPTKLAQYDRLGWSMDVEGDRIVVGAAGWGDNFGDGAIYLFHHDGSRWVDVHEWLRSDYGSAGIFKPNLGLSVALDGTTVFAGAPWADVGDEVNEGATYVYSVTDLGLDAVPDSVPVGGTLQLETWGGLTGAPMGLLLASAGGTPLNIVLGFDVFDASGTATFSLPLSPSVSGLSATFLAGGFWQSGVFALSNTAVVSFQ